jgi:hypothetical protein
MTSYGGIIETSPTYARMTHNVSARGKATCGYGTSNVPWQDAYTWVKSRLGRNDTVVESGALNLDISTMSGYNHVRTTQIDETAGNYAVTETWLLTSSGNTIEDFNISVQKTLEEQITNVTVDGKIVGLESVSYGTSVGDYSVTSYKYNNALTRWSAVSGYLYARCKYAANGVASRTLHTSAVNYSIGHNITEGALTYSYTYNDRPIICTTNALYESIVINDENPQDVFAQLVVPGRTLGPILQDINTTTVASRNVSIEVVMPIVTGCSAALMLAGSPKTAVGVLVDSFQTNLTSSYGQVFKNQDNESWNPRTGRYSRNVGWVYQNC